MANRTYYSEEARNRAYAERSMIAALCIILGVAIGTVVALLFAPEDGESMRNQIADRSSDLLSKAEDQAKKFAS